MVSRQHPPRYSASRRRVANRLSRRGFLRVGLVGMVGFGLSGALAAFLSFFWPRGVQGFGGKVTVDSTLVPTAGTEPSKVQIGRFWLVHLAPSEGTHRGTGTLGPGGLLALWQQCPHLGCSVPWRASEQYEGVRGWFLCPCHGSTYTKAGVRVFGPAPRSLDTMALTVEVDGSVTVDTGSIRKGDLDNPLRAVALVPQLDAEEVTAPGAVVESVSASSDQVPQRQFWAATPEAAVLLAARDAHPNAVDLQAHVIWRFPSDEVHDVRVSVTAGDGQCWIYGSGGHTVDGALLWGASGPGGACEDFALAAD